MSDLNQDFLKRVGATLACLSRGDGRAASIMYEKLLGDRNLFAELFQDPDYEGLLAQTLFAIRGDMGGDTDEELAREQLQLLIERDCK